MFTEGNRKFLYIAGGIFLLFILIIVVVLVKSGGSKKTNTEVSTLTVWALDDSSKELDKVINKFQDSNNIKINYVKKDPANYLNDSLAEIAAGRGPDIWQVPNTWMPKYHEQMVTMPANLIADKKAKKNDVEVYQTIFPKVIASDNIIDNQIYGVPLAADTLQLYYNINLFSNVLSALNKAGNVSNNDHQIFTKGPQNWDEFTRAAQLLTQKNSGTIVQSGAALGTSAVSNANDILTLLMLQNGALMTSTDNTAAEFQTAQNVFGGVSYPGTKALDFYSGFANSGNNNYTWNDSLGDSLRAFAEGKTAMMIGYKSRENDIKRINPNLGYQTINLPQIKETKNPVNFSSYNTFTVTKASKNSSLAWNFIIATKDISNVKTQSADTKSPLLTAKSWYIPDPVKTPDIFLNMIKQVNAGGNSQTAIENAASQMTTLLKALK